MKRLAALALLTALPAAAGVSVLSNTDHIVFDVVQAVTILGGSGITIDQTCPSGSASPGQCSFTATPPFLNPSTLINNAGSTSVAEYLAGTATSTGTPNTHAPYTVLNQSSTGYSLSLDQNNYAALTNAATLYNMAYCGGPGTGDAYPPIAFSTILPNNVGGPLTSQTCGYAVGIEFSMTAGYKGFATGSPSGTTEAMSGVFATLKANHTTWTWGDIKGALRQTASCWATGYASNCTVASVLGFGFGNINYDNANAIAGTASIFLEAPGMAIANHGYYATVTLFPFLTTRRVKEVVYIGGTWPAASTVNELTAAQITAAGGTLVYTSNGSDVEPTFTYAPAATGTATFYALTLDSAGNGSRVESFNPQAESFLVGTSCQQ